MVLFLVAVTFTRSRMGIGMTMLGIMLSVALFSRRIGGDNAFGPVGSLVAIALGLAVTIGLVPVLDRFSAEGVLDDKPLGDVRRAPSPASGPSSPWAVARDLRARCSRPSNPSSSAAGS